MQRLISTCKCTISIHEQYCAFSTGDKALPPRRSSCTTLRVDRLLTIGRWLGVSRWLWVGWLLWVGRLGVSRLWVCMLLGISRLRRLITSRLLLLSLAITLCGVSRRRLLTIGRGLLAIGRRLLTISLRLAMGTRTIVGEAIGRTISHAITSWETTHSKWSSKTTPIATPAI